MKRILTIILVAVTVLSLCACGGNTEEAQQPEGNTLKEGQLMVGFGRVDLSPATSEGVDLVGYGGNGTPPTRMTGVLDKIYGTCIAVSDKDGNTALIYTLDTLYTTKAEVDDVRALITAKTKVPGTNVIISSTHTHAAPHYSSIKGYAEKMAQAAVDAIADQAPATIMTGDTTVKGMNFVRHYVTQDGTVVGDNFSKAVSAFNPRVKHTTEADHQMQLIRFVRGGDKKDIVIVNWQAHPKVSSTAETDVGLAQRSLLSADFPGWCRTHVEEKADVLFAYFTGAAGNLNAISHLPEEKKGYSVKVNEFGAQLGDYVLEAMDQLTEVKADKVGIKQQMFAVTPLDPTNTKVAREMELTAVRFGDIGFTSVPFEMFDTNGMEIKAGSDCKTTFVVTCASMHQHEYVPSTYMWDYNTGSQTAYEFSSNKHERGTAEAVSQELVNMVNGLK